MADQHVEEATRASARVALVTCASFADLHPDDRLLLPPLAARGVRAEPVVWDDPAARWAEYDLAVVRSPWDYTDRRDDFVAWAATVPSLANPADVLAWNTDKRYLAELAAAGVPVVPTEFLEPGRAGPAGPGLRGSQPRSSAPAVRLPAAGEHVVKPAVSAGSRDTGRYDLADPGQRALAERHVARLRDAGRVTMVQPYLPAVDTYGETALIFIAGAFSHAVRKGPMLTGPDTGRSVAELYEREEISAREPTPAERDAARRALAEVPGGADRLLYARVDLIPGPGGAPLLVELELAEPSLFLGTAGGAAARLAAAIAAAARP